MLTIFVLGSEDFDDKDSGKASEEGMGFDDNGTGPGDTSLDEIDPSRFSTNDSCHVEGSGPSDLSHFVPIQLKQSLPVELSKKHNKFLDIESKHETVCFI
ncbi:unnamed protein product [Anisakis simplex]|uniref:RNA-directed DNA polymerase, eukaryota, reverse transcriptase zinc-binding domain protein n=1 Tax=Anisakis simplex TaxID=6269 RepID=A0A0M3IZI2_ANISI|nr:unnamed protein product [Anisakis simplex]